MGKKEKKIAYRIIGDASLVSMQQRVDEYIQGWDESTQFTFLPVVYGKDENEYPYNQPIIIKMK